VPGTPLYSLFSGVLGVQPYPTVIEVTGWLVYAVPMLAYVLWPRTAGQKKLIGATNP
jgi:high-affinity iron transporter